MKKITTLEKAAQYSKNQQKAGYTVGLITGCFDIVHMGHVNFFRFAKLNVDKLIVGLDSDALIKKAKGLTRPINTYKLRGQLLSEFESVDKIFEIKGNFNPGDKRSTEYFKNIYKKIRPTTIITEVNYDRYHNKKIFLAKSLKIESIIYKSRHITTTSEVLKKLEQEF